MKSRKLTSNELQLLESSYSLLLPRHSLLLSEYDKAMKRAATARVKSTFPSRKDWSLPYSVPDNKLLLQGPSPDIVVFYCMTLSDIHTGCSTTVSSSESETPHMRHRRSVVHLKTSSTDSHQFASIKQLFTHTFVHTSYRLAPVEIYAKPQRDLETSIFNVKCNSTSLKIVPLDQVSEVHVTATEDNYIKFWFLDY